MNSTAFETLSSRLPPRESLGMIFSSFLAFEGDRPRQWLCDRRLQRHQHLTQQTAPTNLRGEPAWLREQFWADYWHRQWRLQEPDQEPDQGQQRRLLQPPSVVSHHLAAYLQEPCYWAAQGIARKFTSQQYGVADFFQLAFGSTETVLKNFAPERGAQFKGFAQMVYTNALRDVLRRQREADLCSAWSLLRKISRKRVIEVLNQVGLAPQQQTQYLLAWQCFGAVFVPQLQGGKALDPQPLQWQAIAAAYNQERQIQGVEGKAQDGAKLEQWMGQLAQWLRHALYPTVTSLTPPGEDYEGSWELADPLQPSLLDIAIELEAHTQRDQQQQALHRHLHQSLQDLPLELRQVVSLYYGQDQTQQQIAQQLHKPQAWVSRRLSKARQTLLTQLLQWAEEHRAKKHRAEKHRAKQHRAKEHQTQADPAHQVNNPEPMDEIKAYSLLLEEWLRATAVVLEP